ncbi:hypothetical protein [Nonomuraea sp. ZG12]|uniref:hypothetical protein n=1 Tax=Nonomuraea sp. ZG12 TaxID=3452207 RepID=UPI003F8B0686
MRLGGQLAGAQMTLRGVRSDARDQVLTQILRQRIIGAVPQPRLGPFKRGLRGGGLPPNSLSGVSIDTIRIDISIFGVSPSVTSTKR